MKNLVIFAMLILALSAILSACGGSAPAVPVSFLSVEMSEFKFSPATMTVFVGKEISLNLKNNGAIEHEFAILKKGIVAQIPFDREKQAADILADYRLGPQKSETYTFTLPEAGEYQVICSISGHMESGMTAKLTAVNP
jgi:uncharacterized cupredoxin-like copper-binding protein